MDYLIRPISQIVVLSKLYEIITEAPQNKGKKGQKIIAYDILKDHAAKIYYNQVGKPDIILSHPKYLINYLGKDYFYQMKKLEVKTFQWTIDKIVQAIWTYKRRNQFQSLFCGLCLIIFRPLQTNNFIKLDELEISGAVVFMTPKTIQKNPPKKIASNLTNELHAQVIGKEIVETPLEELKDAFNVALVKLQTKAIIETNEIVDKTNEKIEKTNEKVDNLEIEIKETNIKLKNIESKIDLLLKLIEQK